MTAVSADEVREGDATRPSTPWLHASGHRADLDEIDLAALTPAARLLVLHDGVLTFALEALLLRPVVIELDHQALRPADAEQTTLLDAVGGVLTRRGRIREAERGTVLVHTSAAIVLDVLPRTFEAVLADSRRGLGEALSRLGLALRREPLSCGRRPHSQEVVRRHRIVAAARPACLVEERLDLASPGLLGALT